MDADELTDSWKRIENSISCGQAVPHAVNSLNQLRVVRVVLDLLTEAAYRGLEKIALVGIGESPHGGQQLTVGEYQTPVLKQLRENFELDRRKDDRLTSKGHGMRGHVYNQPASSVNGVFPLKGSSSRHIGSPQRRSDSGRQLHESEWLGQIVVGSRVEPASFVCFLATCRKHDDGHVSYLTQQAAGLPAIELRHGNVEQN